MAASIHIEIIPTEPSTVALSFISSIEDIKDYLQDRIIFKISRITFNNKSSSAAF